MDVKFLIGQSVVRSRHEKFLISFQCPSHRPLLP